METNWQIGSLLRDGRYDLPALNQFIVDIGMEIHNIETPLLAIEEKKMGKMSELELELLNLSATKLEKYKEILDQLLRSSICFENEREKFTSRFFSRQIFWWVGGVASMLGSCVAASTNTSEETKKVFLWINSCFLVLLGIEKIWENCTGRGHIVEKNDRQYLQELSRAIRVVLALQTMAKKQERHHKSHERILHNREKLDVQHRKNERSKTKEQWLQRESLSIIRSAPATDDEYSE